MKIRDGVREKRLQPGEQDPIRGVAYSEPKDLRTNLGLNGAFSKILILRYDDPIA